MAFASVAAMVKQAQETGLPLAEVILRSDLEESGLTAEESRAQMRRLWRVMCHTSAHYQAQDRSASGLSGGAAGRYEQAMEGGRLLGDGYINSAIAEALKTAECNACMKQIVAAPTAGSCGVLPAVLLPLYRSGAYGEEAICRALYVAGGVGQVIAARATLAGAEGGCQAEVGSAAAMAAAALTDLLGGAPQSCAEAAAMALTNLMGLICDPVGGLVELPCVKRNVIGAMDAISAANMALAGLTCRIPCDEVIDAMGAVGGQLDSSLRETARGGLAATPTGKAIAAGLYQGGPGVAPH